MIKVVTLLYRRPGLAIGAFRDYYETHHRRLGEKYLRAYARKYVRRYPMLADGEADAPPFDVMMEVWFDDHAALRAAMQAMGTASASAELADDEAKLFDRDRTQSFVVDECESDLDATSD